MDASSTFMNFVYLFSTFLLFSFVMSCKNMNIILTLLNILGIIKQDLMLLILLYGVSLTMLLCTTLPMATKRVATYY